MFFVGQVSNGRNRPPALKEVGLWQAVEAVRL
jgi:hypothetical protein